MKLEDGCIEYNNSVEALSIDLVCTYNTKSLHEYGVYNWDSDELEDLPGDIDIDLSVFVLEHALEKTKSIFTYRFYEVSKFYDIQIVKCESYGEYSVAHDNSELIEDNECNGINESCRILKNLSSKMVNIDHDSSIKILRNFITEKNYLIKKHQEYAVLRASLVKSGRFIQLKCLEFAGCDSIDLTNNDNQVIDFTMIP